MKNLQLFALLTDWYSHAIAVLTLPSKLPAPTRLETDIAALRRELVFEKFNDLSKVVLTTQASVSAPAHMRVSSNAACYQAAMSGKWGLACWEATVVGIPVWSSAQTDQ